MSTSHTPGPWYGKTSAGGAQGLVYEESTGKTVAVTYDTNDAAIVSAAPDMLEALELCRHILHPGVIGLIANKHGAMAGAHASDAVYALRAAIARAKGEA